MKPSESAGEDNQSLRTFLSHRRIGGLKLVGFEHLQGLDLHCQ